VDPVPDPLLLRKSGSARNRTGDRYTTEAVGRQNDSFIDQFAFRTHLTFPSNTNTSAYQLHHSALCLEPHTFLLSPDGPHLPMERAVGHI
jgi:hypothetical protein